ncbi:hypothetical protein D3C87_718270 [compost metagenome]
MPKMRGCVPQAIGFGRRSRVVRGGFHPIAAGGDWQKPARSGSAGSCIAFEYLRTNLSASLHRAQGDLPPRCHFPTDLHFTLAKESYEDLLAKDSPVRCFIFLCLALPSRVSFLVHILITIMLAQALIAFFLGLDIGARMGPTAKWVMGVSMTLIPLFLVWGFYNHRVGAYNAYILLVLPQFPRALEGFTSSPATTTIALAISIVILAFVWYVRGKIFPDFVFVNPRKIKGKYFFAG